MSNFFSESMSKRTDEELVLIVVYHRDRYQQAAIEAAEAEVKVRGIELANYEHIVTAMTAMREASEAFDIGKARAWARALHYIIDTIVVIALLSLLLIFSYEYLPIENQIVRVILDLGLIHLSFVGYYIFMEHTYQKTLGKFLTKTKVVTIDGQRTELSDIVRRTYCRLIPFDNFSFLIMKDGFHDSMSKTMVVKDSWIPN